MNVALETITGYLNLKDLHQVRYLNTAWNEAAKYHIRKHYFNLSTNANIMKLSALIRKGNRNLFTVPIQKLNIHFYESNFNYLEEFMKQYGNLFVGYRITIPNPITPEVKKSMIHILNKSINLENLEFDKNFGEPKIRYPKLHLQKLTSLTFLSLPKNSETFLKAILEASPALKFLKICGIDVEMTSLISILVHRNIEIVMEDIHPSSLPVTSSFNGNSPIHLTSLSFYNNTFFYMIISSYIPKELEFIQQYTHTIKYLEILSLNVNEEIQFPTMQVLETLYLSFHQYSISRYLQKPQHLPFIRGKFPTLKTLKLKLNESWEIINHFIDSEIPLENVFLDFKFEDDAELNNVVDSLTKFLAAHSQKLKKLELILDGRYMEENPSSNSIKLPVKLPVLEFLQIKLCSDTLMKTFNFGKTENVRMLKMNYGFEYNHLQLQFPNLTSLFLKVDIQYVKDLYKLYQNPIGIEELTLELQMRSFGVPPGGGSDWKILTGLNRGDQDFISEQIFVVHSHNLSHAQDLFQNSKPNIGNMTSLKTLNIWGNGGNDSMAILFLVFCGKLKNLRKFRTCSDPYNTCSSTVFDDVFSQNNTQFFLVPATDREPPETFLEPFTKLIP